MTCIKQTTQENKFVPVKQSPLSALLVTLLGRTYTSNISSKVKMENGNIAIHCVYGNDSTYSQYFVLNQKGAIFMKELTFKRKRQSILLIGIAGIILFFAFSLPLKLDYYINITNSVPIGIYQKIPYNELKRGDFIVFRLPEPISKEILGRPWYKKETTILKQISGVEGDTYEISNQLYFINDQLIGHIATTDNDGKPLPHIPEGRYHVRKDHILSIATHTQSSFDSRYYGDIPIKNIESKVKPLWILP